MSLHRVDPRFALPHVVRTATVLDGLDGWRDGLEDAGVEMRQRGDVDLVVCPPRRAAEAAALGAPALIVDGPADVSPAAGYRTRRILLRPTRERPTLALPLDQRAASSYALEHWSVVDRRWKRLRMEAARALVSRGRFPPWASPLVTIASRAPGAPAFVAASGELGVPEGVGWFLSLGQGDALSRNAFQLFPDGSREPEWVLKFARVAGYAWRFDSDERGLRLAQTAGGAVAAHVPRLLGRFEVGGINASLETAAPGRRLRDVLQAPGGREAKLALVERIAGWIVELGRASSGRTEALRPELERLQVDVLPGSLALGVDTALVDRLPPLSPVTTHNDLGTWNVVAGGGSFAVVDWENAREAGLPLWDLLYFLADALTLVDGAGAPQLLPERMARLFAGEGPSSKVLFTWVRRAAEAARVPPGAVGAVATLCWRSHSLSSVAHNADIARWAPGDPPRSHGFDGLAEAWLRHPGLGPAWPAFGGRSGG